MNVWKERPNVGKSEVLQNRAVPMAEGRCCYVMPRMCRKGPCHLTCSKQAQLASLDPPSGSIFPTEVRRARCRKGHISTCSPLAFLYIITLVIHKYLSMGDNLDYNRSNQADLKYV